MLTIKELQDDLQKQVNFKISQVEIAKALGTTKANISLRIKNNSMAKLQEIEKVVKYFNIPQPHVFLNEILNKQKQYSVDYISEENMPDDDMLDIDYYPDVFGSCGNGTFVFSEQKEQITIPRRIINSYSGFKTYSVINARGDSMSPYIIDKDKLVVEHWKVGQQIIDNRIYVFRFNDNIFIKRLVLNIDQIIVKSDNKEYQTRNIEKYESDNFQIIGRIVGIWREEL